MKINRVGGSRVWAVREPPLSYPNFRNHFLWRIESFNKTDKFRHAGLEPASRNYKTGHHFSKTNHLQQRKGKVAYPYNITCSMFA